MADGDISYFRYVQHGGVEQEVGLGDEPSPAHHSHYSLLRKIENPMPDDDASFIQMSITKLATGQFRLVWQNEREVVKTAVLDHPDAADALLYGMKDMDPAVR